MLLASIRWLGLRGDSISNVLVTSVSVGAMLATQSPGGYLYRPRPVVQTMDSAIQPKNHYPADKY